MMAVLEQSIHLEKSDMGELRNKIGKKQETDGMIEDNLLSRLITLRK